MANVDPQTLQELQDSINTLVNNDNDTPEVDSDDWNTILNLIYLAIRAWGTTQDILWRELWSTYTHGSTLSGTTTYTLTTLTNYRFPGGAAQLVLNGVTSYVPFIKPEEAQEYIDAGGKGVYITGSALNGYTLNLTWTPTAGDGTYGATVIFNYYKFPYKPTEVTEKVEMSDPNFIVYWVAAQKALLDSQRNKYSVFSSLADESMDNMRVMNDMLPFGHRNTPNDIDALNGAVLGE